MAGFSSTSSEAMQLAVAFVATVLDDEFINTLTAEELHHRMAGAAGAFSLISHFGLIESVKASLRNAQDIGLTDAQFDAKCHRLIMKASLSKERK